MTSYRCVHEFTDAGLRAFRRVFEGDLPEDALSPTDPQFATRCAGSQAIDDAPAATSKELAGRVLESLGPNWSQLLPKPGVWAWLTFVLRDSVFPKQADGARRPGERHRWDPSDPGDYRKSQRHLVRMPVVLLGNLGESVDHLLCGPPSVLPEVREQLTGRQDMLTRAFQGAARALYYDEPTQGLKRGTGGKGAGSPRRLRDLHRQLDVTWDLFGLDAAGIVKLLPKEFDRFLPQRAPPHT